MGSKFFRRKLFLYKETVQAHMDGGGVKHTLVEDRVFVFSFICQLFKSSKLGPVILTLRKTLRWREASLDCLIGGQVLFFVCMSHGKLILGDGNALRVHETNQKPRAFELFSCVITLRANVTR